jgi:hypothetical protein
MLKAKKPVILPKVPSKLIGIALRDIEKAEASRKYKINMASWHRPNSHCSVCAAGSVMAFSLGAKSGLKYHPYDFPENRDQLLAINWLRLGDVSCANAEMNFGGAEAVKKFNRGITDYDYDQRLFKRDMRKLAADLRKAGF